MTPTLLNEIVLVARVVEMSSLRYTPAGIPALDLVLEHESSQRDAGQLRQVKLLISGLAFGLLAETLLKQNIGKALRLTGFLSQGRSKKSIKLHIQQFEPIEDAALEMQASTDTSLKNG